MVKLYLPTGSKPVLSPETERQELLNRLWEAKYWVPGAKELEVSQLRDIVAYAEERAAEDEAKIAFEAQQKISKMPKEQVAGAIKEFLAWRNKKQGKKVEYLG